MRRELSNGLSRVPQPWAQALGAEAAPFFQGSRTVGPTVDFDVLALDKLLVN
jgi:hypothetical protein